MQEINNEFYRNPRTLRARLGRSGWDEARTIGATALVAAVAFLILAEILHVFLQVDGIHFKWPPLWLVLVIGYWAGRRDMRDELTRDY